MEKLFRGLACLIPVTTKIVRPGQMTMGEKIFIASQLLNECTENRCSKGDCRKLGEAFFRDTLKMEPPNGRQAFLKVARAVIQETPSSSCNECTTKVALQKILKE